MATFTATANSSSTIGYAQYGSTTWNKGTTNGACQGAYQGTTASKSRVGVMVFSGAGAALRGKVITQITLKITCSAAGSASTSKKLSFRRANYQTLQTGIAGSAQVGAAMGTLTGKFYNNTTTHTLNSSTNAALFEAMKAYFAEGNSALVLYNGETSGSSSYSSNYARVTTCVLTVTYMDATVWYRDGGTWKQCTVWYRNGGAWVQVVPYGKQVNALCDALIRPVQIDAAAAWDDFAHNTIAYFHVLEDIVPGILGNDDRLYGLPEDLAREIQEECFFPDGLKCDLRRYQEWGVKYILHQGRVLLGDEMGLGKTIQAIAAMVSLRNTGATHFLVVCPASVLSNWCKEIAEKSKLRVTKIHGQGRMNAFKEWQRTGGAGVTTFETTGYLVMEAEERFHLMIVDEAHYIKNGEARRTVNVKRIGEHADRMLFMTGTALENKVDEMISLVTILQPTVAAQLHDYAFMSSAPQFREKIAPVYYRRKREDVLTELPELIENNEWCALWGEEERVYERTVLEEHYMTIRRVSWNVGDLSQSSKAKRMKEIIEEAEADGRKTIVFSFFLDTISKIRDFLGARCTQPINGAVSLQRRQEIIDEFDKAPAGTVLLAQIQSGGTGLNIQSASVVILCEPQLKPSIENQAISRAYRMGQARNVLVYRLLCEDTIDERIMDMLAQKQAVFDAFADQSVAAVATAREEIALDDKTMGKLVKEEIERINAKRSGTASAGKQTRSAVMDAVAQ